MMMLQTYNFFHNVAELTIHNIIFSDTIIP